MRTFSGACRSDPVHLAETRRLLSIRRTLHLAATTDSLRTAPSLPFDGVIPCQSGATIHGPALEDSGPRSPVRNEAVCSPSSFKTNYNTPRRMSRLLGTLKIPKNIPTSSNHSPARATGALSESEMPRSNQRALASRLGLVCHKSWSDSVTQVGNPMLFFERRQLCLPLKAIRLTGTSFS
jgi:hypothetical protein